MLKTTKVSTGSGTAAAVTSAGADAVSNTQNDQAVESRLYGFNNTTWDRLRQGISVVKTTLIGFLNVIPYGVYNATRPVAADTNGLPPQIDTEGKQIVLPYAKPVDMVSGVTAAIVDTTSTQVLAAPGAGLRNYITSIIVTNSHATVSTFVTILDGNAGTIIWEGYALAAGGGFVCTFPTPLKQPTTATRLDVKCVTTGANVIASVAGYIGA